MTVSALGILMSADAVSGLAESPAASAVASSKPLAGEPVDAVGDAGALVVLADALVAEVLAAEALVEVVLVADGPDLLSADASASTSMISGLEVVRLRVPVRPLDAVRFRVVPVFGPEPVATLRSASLDRHDCCILLHQSPAILDLIHAARRASHLLRYPLGANGRRSP
ncbi:MAG: hypothetical protein ACE360_15920 [Hyphomicrobiales bacterium]